MIIIHTGIVWVIVKQSGWYMHLKAFPEAMKKIAKDEYGPDCDHQSVKKYLKDIGLTT